MAIPKPAWVGRLIDANKQEIKQHKKILLFIFLANKKKEKYAVSFTKISLIQYANSALKMPYNNV